MSETLPRESHATTSRSTTRCIEVVGNGSGVQTDRTSALSAARGVGGEVAQEAAAGQNRLRVEFGLRDSGCKCFEPTIEGRLSVRQGNEIVHLHVQVGERGLERAYDRPGTSVGECDLFGREQQVVLSKWVPVRPVSPRRAHRGRGHRDCPVGDRRPRARLKGDDPEGGMCHGRRRPRTDCARLRRRSGRHSYRHQS